MKNKSTVILVTGCLIFILLMAFFVRPDEAQAIPAFARKYKMSCTTCHAPVPRLKAYGDEFAGNGFVLKDQEATRYFMDTGDDQLNLIRDFPVAVRLEGFIKHQTVTDKEVDLTVPYNLKFLSGGSLTKNVAYYFYFFFSERGEVAGVEDAYIMFNDLFGQDLDIYLGQFQVSDPLFKRELRLTYEDYMIYKHKTGESHINLAYDRGLMLTWGFPTGTDFIVEIINGNGIGEADDNRTYDNDKYKNFVGRLSQDVGENLRVGGFGYYGKEKCEENDSNNEMWTAGADATISYEDRFEANLQYLERRDDNPQFESIKPNKEIETRGGMVEMILMPDGDRSKYYAAALFNYIESDLDNYFYRTFTAHIGYMMRTNIRLIAENTYDIENEENRFVIGFVAAF